MGRSGTIVHHQSMTACLQWLLTSLHFVFHPLLARGGRNLGGLIRYTSNRHVSYSVLCFVCGVNYHRMFEVL
jgi:hypothetical protein